MILVTFAFSLNSSSRWLFVPPLTKVICKKDILNQLLVQSVFSNDNLKFGNVTLFLFLLVFNYLLGRFRNCSSVLSSLLQIIHCHHPQYEYQLSTNTPQGEVSGVIHIFFGWKVKVKRICHLCTEESTRKSWDGFSDGGPFGWTCWSWMPMRHIFKIVEMFWYLVMVGELVIWIFNVSHACFFQHLMCIMIFIVLMMSLCLFTAREWHSSVLLLLFYSVIVLLLLYSYMYM